MNAFLALYLKPEWRRKMSKVALEFVCNDSYGRKFELVMDEDRNWWTRSYIYNGYGMGWSKWAKSEPRKVTFYTKIISYGDFGNVEKGRCHVASISNGFSGNAIDILSFKGKRIKKSNYKLPKINKGIAA